MPVVRSFTRGQWEALGRRLDALPEKGKDEQHLKVGDGVKSIRTQIGAAREKGYTLNELIEQAAQEGIDVNLNSLRYAMRRAEGKGRIRRESKDAVRDHPAGPARSRKPAQKNAVRDKPLRAGTQQKGDGGVTRSGPCSSGLVRRSRMRSHTLCATAISARRKSSPCTGNQICARPLRRRVSRWISLILRIALPTNFVASACRYARQQK